METTLHVLIEAIVTCLIVAIAAWFVWYTFTRLGLAPRWTREAPTDSVRTDSVRTSAEAVAAREAGRAALRAEQERVLTELYDAHEQRKAKKEKKPKKSKKKEAQATPPPLVGRAERPLLKLKKKDLRDSN